MPVYNNVSETAKTKANEANIRTLQGAITIYLADKGGGAYANVTLSNAGVWRVFLEAT